MSDYRERYGRGGIFDQERINVARNESSQLQRYIERACDSSNYEPNLALDLEIADLINQRKGNAPRETAVAIVKHINDRNPNVALLSLAISTKEFLNELVRRFPERPPPRPTRVQLRILEAIEEWRQTICKSSRYKDDLGFIRDMHRLLSYKGYVFPEITHDVAAVLNPSESLRSAEEIEQEERTAQSAKLQELIRRGAPTDLMEANHLMKVMAGYDKENRTDYRAKAAEEIERIRRKSILLDEMLSNATRGDTIGQQDAFEDLSNSIHNAQPKLQRFIEDEKDDTDAVLKLLDVNDMINGVLERYQFVKKGNFDTKSAIVRANLNVQTETDTSLIDFVDELKASDEPIAAISSEVPRQADLLGDLEGLDLANSDTNYGVGGNIALELEPKSALKVDSGVGLVSKSPDANDSKPEMIAEGFLLGHKREAITILKNSHISIDFAVVKLLHEQRILVTIKNDPLYSVDELKFLVAVSKMERQSDRHMKATPGQQISQRIAIKGATPTAPAKVRWKLTCNILKKGEQIPFSMEESGEQVL